MNNYLKNTAKIILSLSLLATLYACDSNNTGAIGNTANVAKTEIPAELQKLALPNPGTGTGLSAYVLIDGNTAKRQAMTIDPAGTGSASATVSNLTLAMHTVLIIYEYDDGSGPITVASASKSVDLTGGTGSIDFVAADYDFASYDDNNNGISNAAELAAAAGT